MKKLLKDKKGSVSLYITYIILAVIIIVIAAVVAPFGVLFNSELYAAGEEIILDANETISQIQNDTIRNSIQANFGKSVAIDSTDMKAWSNGSKARKSDPDAGWVIKGDTNGKRKFVWGYKMHLMVDTVYEIPITANITKGNIHDVCYATPLLSQARFTTGKFHPQYVICGAGYDSNELRKTIKRQWRAKPIIKARKTHRKWIGFETPDWQLIYNRRTSVERVFSRMKTQRHLNDITVRHRYKVTIHSLIPVIVKLSLYIDTY